MTTSSRDSQRSIPVSNEPLKRRGLFAIAVAVVAGLVAKFTETPVSAGADGDVVLGGTNPTNGQTVILCSGTNGLGFFTASAVGPAASGMQGRGNKYGVVGECLGTGDPGAGLYGLGATNSPAVLGLNGIGVGVRGESTIGVGVIGTSQGSNAVIGQIPSTATGNAVAVYAVNSSTYAGPGPGAGGFAIYGLCAKGHGLVGATATAGGAAVVGATNGVAGAYAAAFYGPVAVIGRLTVSGGPKSAAVPHPDGSHRRLYCMESPESWFEDFGTGHLDCGRAEVVIDPDFAALVDLASYHVFLTGYDDFDLRVSGRTSTGFSVEARNIDSHGQFSWRLVAKRKDIAADRLETVTIPVEPALPSPLA